MEPDRPLLLRDGSAVAWSVAGLGAGVLLILLPTSIALSGTVLTTILTALSLADVRLRLLPDALTYPLIGIGLGLSIAGLGPTLLNASLGGLFGYGVIFCLAKLYRRTRGIEGLGLGDAKLLCGLGIWTGAQMLPLIAFSASVAGLVWYAAWNFRTTYSLRHELAFGPFLAAAGWLAFIAFHLGVDPAEFLARRFAALMA